MRDRCRVNRAFAVRALLGALLVLMLPSGAASPLNRAPTLKLIHSDSGLGAILEAEWTEANEPGEAARRMTESRVAELAPGQRERMAEGSSGTGEAGGFDPFDLIFLCVPGYFLLQATLTLRTSGGWRKAALVPAVIMVPILAFTVLAFAAQSNLWPLLMLISAPLAFLYLVVLSLILLLRRLVKAA
jgi:hypothetical protein